MNDELAEVTIAQGVSQKEFDRLWHARDYKVDHLVMPDVPFFLNGELVEDPERMKQKGNDALYMTPRVRGYDLLMSVYTEREPMVKEAMGYQITDQVREIRGFCFEPQQTHPRLHLKPTPDLSGISAVGVPPDVKEPDLRNISANDLFRSIHACRFAYSVFTNIDFGGAELLVNFRCDMLVRDLGSIFDRQISSVANWGLAGPPW